MIELGGNYPAGWVYVASHPMTPGYTKIGYSQWHPIDACFRYPNGFKRLQHLEFSLRAFGFGELEKWSSDYHDNAKGIESAIRTRLKALKRQDVGKSREIFEITREEAISIVKEYI